MRLIMRANAHRVLPAGDGPDGVELASSPDTIGRPERWLWHIRLLQAPAATGAGADDVRTSRLDLGGTGTLEVAFKADDVTAEVELLDLADSRLLQRDEAELVALVASSGKTLVEDRHLLAEGDTLVLEGDDPMSVRVRPTDGRSAVALVRLRSGSGAVSWVP
jgi:hypothetical protein